jgi:hypothetical protein
VGTRRAGVNLPRYIKISTEFAPWMKRLEYASVPRKAISPPQGSLEFKNCESPILCL